MLSPAVLGQNELRWHTLKTCCPKDRQQVFNLNCVDSSSAYCGDHHQFTTTVFRSVELEVREKLYYLQILQHVSCQIQK